MEIKVYSGFSKAINSTKQPTGGTTKTVRLKDGCSVINPVFLLTGYDLSNNYVSWGSRYYYIDDIVILHNDLAEYHCSTDVLATYKDNIGASSQYVVRSASSYDPKVIDTRYPTIADTDEGFVPLTDISSGIDYSNGTFVLGVKSKDSDTGVAFYALTPQQFGDFCAYLYSDQWLTATDITVTLQKMLNDPFDYIISCNWYPFTLSFTSAPLYFGFFDWTGHSMARIPESSRIKSFSHTGTLPDHPQIARGSYLNAAPFTKMMLNLYSFGQCVLDPNRFLDSRSVTVTLNIDLFTGIGVCRVLSSTGVVFQSSATCSVPIQLSQARIDLTRPLTALAGAAENIGADNYLGAAAAIGDAVKGAVPQISSMGAVGSMAAYYYNAPIIDCIFYRISAEDQAQIGRPLCAPRTISGLSGFIQCDSVDLDTVASKAEKTEIIAYMEGGFFYE